MGKSFSKIYIIVDVFSFRMVKMSSFDVLFFLFNAAPMPELLVRGPTRSRRPGQATTAGSEVQFALSK